MSNVTRSAGILFKLVVLLAIAALLIALSYNTWANTRATGVFSFHPFDSAWWQPGVDKAEPVVESGKHAASDANDAVWGSGGLVERTEAWWSGRAASAAIPVAPGTRSELDAALARAETQFDTGLAAYRRANPSDGAFTPERRAALIEAKAAFTAVRGTLDAHLPAYRALPDHDAHRLADLKALSEYNDRLLSSVATTLDRWAH